MVAAGSTSCPLTLYRCIPREACREVNFPPSQERYCNIENLWACYFWAQTKGNQCESYSYPVVYLTIVHRSLYLALLRISEVVHEKDHLQKVVCSDMGVLHLLVTILSRVVVELDWVVVAEGLVGAPKVRASVG